MPRVTRKGRRTSALEALVQEQDQLAELVAEAAGRRPAVQDLNGQLRRRQQPKLWSMPPSTSLAPPPPTPCFRARHRRRPSNRRCH